MSFDIAEVVNPFPSPPDRYKLFTDKNIELLRLLRERTGTTVHDPLPEDTSQVEILHDQPHDGITDDLLILEKPRLDWIVEGGRFDMYADVWKIVDGQPIVPDKKASNYLVAQDIADKRDALRRMLKTILHSYYELLGAISEHIPVDDHVPTLYEEEAMFMAEIAYSFMDVVNGFRSLQARETLEQLLIKQLNDRRDETKKIHEKCDAIAESLASLRTQVNEVRGRLATSEAIHCTTNPPASAAPHHVSEDEVLSWADEVV